MAVSESTASGLSAPPAGWWTKAHWGLLMVALAVLLAAGQGQHFFYDEWAFIGGKRDALPLPDRYLLPHNEHWILLPLLAYRTLRATLGVGSYWPYLGLLILLHLGVTHVLWRLMLVTGSRPIVATSAAGVFSVLGAGAENLVWAFQIAFVGATLLGASAVYLAVTGAADWRKTAVLTCLTTAGLATSGVGVAYLIVVPLVYAWRHRRHAVVVLCLPLMLYVTWHSLYGRSLTNAPSAWEMVPLVVGGFVAIGLTTALAGYFGLETNNSVPLLAVGTLILAGLTLACRDWIADRTLAGRSHLAMCLGAVTFFGTAGLARGGLGLGMATSPRYVYVTLVLLLPALALVISGGPDRYPPLVRAVVPVAIAMAMSNVFQLFAFADETRHNSNASRRVLMAASDLVNSNTPLFAEQLPEPKLAPDVTTADFGSGHLDSAFDVTPEPSDRLTASLNLQIQVVSGNGGGATSPCRVIPKQRITVPISRRGAPIFAVTADGPFQFTLHDAGLSSSPRLVNLIQGTYLINSIRETGSLTIQPNSPAALLAAC